MEEINNEILEKLNRIEQLLKDKYPQEMCEHRFTLRGTSSCVPIYECLDYGKLKIEK